MNFADNPITNRQSFIKMVNTLRQQLITGDETFANTNLSDFLEALSRYAEDIQGYYDNTSQPVNADEPGWQLFADLLKGASMYE